MLSLLVTLLVTAPEIPAQCQGPAAREMGPLTQFAQTSGSLSVGLDSVATWCFDSNGAWTGGAEKANPKATPMEDCKKAIESCEAAKKTVSAEARQLLFDTLNEMNQPFLGVKYQPKRSGLGERPPEGADCSGRDRSLLFSSAQARMDLARLASVVQNEYANYRTWLFSEGLKCAQQVARDEKDPTRRGVAIDSKVKGGGTQQVPGGDDAGVRTVITGAPVDAGVRFTSTPVDAGTRVVSLPVDAGARVIVAAAPFDAGTRVTADQVPTMTQLMTMPVQTGTYVGGPTTERERALASTMIEKWRYFLSEQQKIEGDVDWVSGFMASRELRDCRCPLPRPVPGDVVRRLANNDRVQLLQQDDERNTKCELCLLDSYPKWKVRAQKQCALLAELTPYEIEVLQRSDDGNGLPPRCVELAKKKLENPATPAMRTGVVRLGPDDAPQQVVQKQAVGGHFIVMQVDAGTPEVAPVVQQSAPVQPMTTVVQSAPIERPSTPARETGRVYLHVSMSRTCMAEVLLPQAIALHDGDVLQLPLGVPELTVRGACGGTAELLYGKEETPRASEPFSSDKPVTFRFAKRNE